MLLFAPSTSDVVVRQVSTTSISSIYPAGEPTVVTVCWTPAAILMFELVVSLFSPTFHWSQWTSLIDHVFNLPYGPSLSLHSEISSTFNLPLHILWGGTWDFLPHTIHINYFVLRVHSSRGIHLGWFVYCVHFLQYFSFSVRCINKFMRATNRQLLGCYCSHIVGKQTDIHRYFLV